MNEFIFFFKEARWLHTHTHHGHDIWFSYKVLEKGDEPLPVGPFSCQSGSIAAPACSQPLLLYGPFPIPTVLISLSLSFFIL